MPDKILIINALLNAFPTVVSFQNFKENDPVISQRAIPGIVKFAFHHQVIAVNSEEAFIDFLKQNASLAKDGKPPADLTFSNILEILSGNLSVNALIAQLEITARELSFPEIQASMITRLKKRFVVNTPKKRALLRILAFKLAQKCPDVHWHYELLLQLPLSADDRIAPVQETAGITISFQLQGQGEVIIPADVTWLKNELSDCIAYLRLDNHIHKNIIETTGATSFNLRSPKKPGPLDEPRLYNQPIRNVMAIAHQMSARWLLSHCGSPHKRLIIIIHAGMMSTANTTIQRILADSLTAESGIYLTDFAHLCALYASVKAGFERYTRQADRTIGHSSNIWSVNYFLSYNYYDYIPCLLTDNMLPRSVSESAYDDFKRMLHFPEQAGHSSFGAIKAMHRFPQSALLLTEIAKVLCARRMPFEADAVLANLLLTSPRNLVARLMRMLIYANIAKTQTDLASAKMAFDRACAEGNFIVGCSEQDSDVWHEIGVLHFGRAVKYFKCLREKNPALKDDVKKTDLLDQLGQARDCFLKSMTISATGKALNSLYMLGYTLCLIELLSSGKSRNCFFGDSLSVFKTISARVFRNIGWLRDDAATADGKLEKVFQNLLLTLNLVIARYENLVLCRSNIPFMKYMFALILWDFAPAITPQICRMTKEWLKIAQAQTEKLLADNVAVYHVAYGNISAEKFLLHIQETLDVINKHVSDDELKQEKDPSLMQDKFRELSRIKLMLLELDRSHKEQMILCA